MRRYGRLAGFASEDAERSYFEAYDAALALSPMPLEPIDVPTAPFGTTRVYVAGPADAPPLVVLHAKSCTATMWLDLLPTFTATHRTYLVDAIGDPGRSTTTRMFHGSDDITRWIDGLLDGLGAERAAVVGLSNGGFQAATYATDRPQRVERVATVAPAALYQRIAASWWRSTMPVMFLGGRQRCERYWATFSVATDRSPLQRAHDELMVRFFVGMKAARRDAFPRTYKADRLARMTMPVLAVFGRQDILYDGDIAAAKARAALPHARVEVLDSCGHMVNFDQPVRLGELLGTFLAAGVSAAEPAGGTAG